MKNEKDIAAIHAYLESSLSELGRTAFEERLRREPALLHAFEQYQDGYAFAQAIRRIRLLDELERVQQPMVTSRRRFFVRRWWITGIAAGFLLFLMAAGWWYGNLYYSNDALLETHFAAYPSPGNLKGEPTAPANTFQKAMQQYDQGNFANAAALFHAVDPSDVLFPQGQFYAGIAHLAVNDSRSAIGSLLIAADFAPDDLKEAAKWYLSLAYLANGQEDIAKRTLEELAETSNDIYGEKAGQVLNDLKGFWRKWQ